MDKLIIIGDSGHAKVIKDLASNKYKIAAIIDDKYERHTLNGCLYGPISELQEIIKETGGKVIIAIGNNKVRKKITEMNQLTAEHFVSLISDHAIISPTVKIGYGTIVMPGAIINADAVIGNNVIINTASVVEHDCVIGNYCHISPNSTLTGGVVVGEGTQISAGAVVNPLCQIGEWTMVGSGAAVINHLPANVTAVGIPASIKEL